MNEVDIFNVLRPIVLSMTTVPTAILGNPNEPAPSGPYASILPSLTIVERGQAIIYNENDGINNINRTVKAQQIAECSINFYRDNAHYNAGQMMQANKVHSVWLQLYENKLGWIRTGPVNNLNFLQSNNWEPRAQISIFLAVEATIIKENINTIEQLQVIIENEDGNIIADTNIKTDDTP